MKKTVIILSALLVVVATYAMAKTSYLNTMKSLYNIGNGSKLDSCNTCHDGQWSRNAYGDQLETANIADDVNAAFAATDDLNADGDPALNWVELVNGTWPADPNDSVPVGESTWGKIKALYH